MARDTPLGFPAHTLPYRRGEFTTLSTVSRKQPARSGRLLASEQNREKSSYCIQRGFVLNYYNYNRLK